MAITSADVNTRIEAYDTAMAAGDFSLARIELMRAKGLIVGLPDMTGQDGAQLRYGRETINDLLEQLKDLDTEADLDATGKSWLKTQLVRPGRPGSRKSDPNDLAFT